jgi:RimJ/RimL family protein N-acetyltransferase
VTTSSVALVQRPVAPTDLEFLRDLFADARGEEFAALPAETRRPLLDMQFALQRQQYEARYPESRHEIVEIDGAAVGRVWTFDDGDRLRILDITLLSGHRGHGIGTGVLTQLIDGAGERPVVLDVWAANLAARRLYERLGFVAVSDGDGYVAMQRTRLAEKESR